MRTPIYIKPETVETAGTGAQQDLRVLLPLRVLRAMLEDLEAVLAVQWWAIATLLGWRLELD